MTVAYLYSYRPSKGICVQAVKAGQPCKGLGTCVENAECTSSTQGVCRCNDNFLEQAGVCVTLKEADQECTGEEECTPNSICLDTCRCRVGFYKVRFFECRLT